MKLKEIWDRKDINRFEQLAIELQGKAAKVIVDSPDKPNEFEVEVIELCTYVVDLLPFIHEFEKPATDDGEKK